VRVYVGAAVNFTLYEDDGMTLAYQQGQFRSTSLEWLEEESTFVWKVTGPYSSPKTTFDLLQVRLPFDSPVVRAPTGRRNNQ